MFGFLRNIFLKKPVVQEAAALEHIKGISPSDFVDGSYPYEDRVARALLFFVGKQVLLMGYELEAVPIEKRFVSKGCRGYLVGVAHGIITCLGQKVDENYLNDLVCSSFILVFGRENGRKIAEEFLREGILGTGLANGYVFGSNEVEAVFSSPSVDISSGVGFDHFANFGT
ncbi:hypothetical protein [Erythrobacter sp.]|uniref:hypothetical protein n=1 Tax=Erythrobacter sp. TaxID=1042 RepID=UPI0025F62A4D|nr:hypothetical protein [Erythrobacter sp.]